jgi:hypothetical protein
MSLKESLLRKAEMRFLHTHQLLNGSFDKELAAVFPSAVSRINESQLMGSCWLEPIRTHRLSLLLAASLSINGFTTNEKAGSCQ